MTGPKITLPHHSRNLTQHVLTVQAAPSPDLSPAKNPNYLPITTSEDHADFALFAPQIQLKRPPQLAPLEQQPKTLAGWLFRI